MIKINDGEKIDISNSQEKIYREDHSYDINKIREGLIGREFKVGSINYETPTSKFLKNNLNRDLSSYIWHKEINIKNRNDKLTIFILKDLIAITDRLESENYEKPNNQVHRCSILNIKDSFFQKIEYTSIYDSFLDVNENNRNLILKLIKSDNFSALSELVITFRSFRDLNLVSHLIDSRRSMSWQKFFECNISIRQPITYQNHYFLKKISKRGRLNSRVITFTNKFIMSIPFKLTLKDSASIFELDAIKRALAIESIKSLTHKNNTLLLKLTFDNSVQLKIDDSIFFNSKTKKEIEFLFYYESDIARFVFNCRNIFYSLTRTFLQTNNI